MAGARSGTGRFRDHGMRAPILDSVMILAKPLQPMIRICTVLLVAALLSLSGIGGGVFAADETTAQSLAQASQDAANDPIEPVNRAIFSFNDFLQRLIIRPLAELYVLMLPDMVRDGVRNVLSNIRTPVVLANDILQGEGGRALETTQRFFINTTMGVGGFFDAADKMGIKVHDEDFGQTLAVWGIGEGFYLVLPLFGPSNPRDAVGKLGDFYLDPVSQWSANTDRDEITYARTLVSGVDSFSRVMDELQKLKDTSIDYYAAVRSISRQKRETDIRNGKPSEGAPLPDIKYDFNAKLSAASY